MPEVWHAEMLQVSVGEHQRMSPWLKHFVTKSSFLNEICVVAKWSYYSEIKHFSLLFPPSMHFFLEEGQEKKKHPILYLKTENKC